jgi:outer membrane protein assembly factor BamB
MKHNIPTLIFFVLLIIFIMTAPLYIGGKTHGTDWPRWRGPNGDGISTETDWDPEALKDGPKIIWKTNVGMGLSNVAIKGKYLYTMGSDYEEDIVYCLNAETGEEVWRYSYPCSWGSFGPQATPTVDGKYVYTLSIEGHLHSLNAKNGKIGWEKNIVKEFGAVRPKDGFSGSPVIEGDLVIITTNTSGLAIIKKTGEKVWASEPSETTISWVHGSEYATPVIYDYKGKRSAAILSSGGLYSVDASTGEQQWFYDWKPYIKVSAADPVIFDNKVFISAAYNAGSTLLDISGNEPRVLWKSQNMENHFSTSVLIDGYIYGSDADLNLPHDGSRLTCLDIKTGEKMWSEDMKPLSLIAADGKLIALNEKGTLFIVEATPSSYKLISSGRIPDQKGFEKWWTSPVLVRGRIYCRNFLGHLVSIDVSR